MNRSILILLIAVGSTIAFAGPPDEALKAQARVSESDARVTALAKVSNGTVQSSELEKENGRLIWSFDIASPKSKDITEVNVDAVTGKIVASHTESPAYQKGEAKAEKKEEATESSAPKETH